MILSLIKYALKTAKTILVNLFLISSFFTKVFSEIASKYTFSDDILMIDLFWNIWNKLFFRMRSDTNKTMEWYKTDKNSIL